MPRESPYSEKYHRDLCNGTLARVKALAKYEIDTSRKIKSPLSLVRPETPTVLNAKDDYDLSQFSTQSVPVTVLEGNHFTILDNPRLIEVINNSFIYN